MNCCVWFVIPLRKYCFVPYKTSTTVTVFPPIYPQGFINFSRGTGPGNNRDRDIYSRPENYNKN